MCKVNEETGKIRYNAKWNRVGDARVYDPEIMELLSGPKAIPFSDAFVRRIKNINHRMLPEYSDEDRQRYDQYQKRYRQIKVRLLNDTQTSMRWTWTQIPKKNLVEMLVLFSVKCRVKPNQAYDAIHTYLINLAKAVSLKSIRFKRPEEVLDLSESPGQRHPDEKRKRGRGRKWEDGQGEEVRRHHGSQAWQDRLNGSERLDASKPRVQERQERQERHQRLERLERLEQLKRLQADREDIQQREDLLQREDWEDRQGGRQGGRQQDGGAGGGGTRWPQQSPTDGPRRQLIGGAGGGGTRRPKPSPRDGPGRHQDGINQPHMDDHSVPMDPETQILWQRFLSKERQSGKASKSVLGGGRQTLGGGRQQSGGGRQPGAKPPGRQRQPVTPENSGRTKRTRLDTPTRESTLDKLADVATGKAGEMTCEAGAIHDGDKSDEEEVPLYTPGSEVIITNEGMGFLKLGTAIVEDNEPQGLEMGWIQVGNVQYTSRGSRVLIPVDQIMVMCHTKDIKGGKQDFMEIPDEKRYTTRHVPTHMHALALSKHTNTYHHVHACAGPYRGWPSPDPMRYGFPRSSRRLPT